MPSIRSYFIKPLLKPLITSGLSPSRSIEKQRKHFERTGLTLPVPRGTQVQQRTLPHCSAEWLLPKELGRSAPHTNKPVLLYLHGGGYVVGSPRSYRALVGNFIRRLQCPALVPNYRLAPDHPFPAALNDAYDAWQYLRQSGYAAEQIVLAGDSAGGGLATALMLKLRDLNQPMPAGALLISPWLDLTLSGASFTERQNREAVLNPDWIRAGAKHYSDEHDETDAYLSPIFSEPSGLPPLLIHVGTEEVLYDDSTRFAALAKRVGVDVQLEEWQGMWHDWHVFAAVLPEARQALDDSSRWLLEQLAGHQPG